MNEVTFGPLSELSRHMQRVLKCLGIYDEKYYYIVGRVYSDLKVEDTLLTSKYRVGTPYEYAVKSILMGDKMVLQVPANTMALCICEPLRWVQAKHEAEIKDSLASANETWFRG